MRLLLKFLLINVLLIPGLIHARGHVLEGRKSTHKCEIPKIDLREGRKPPLISETSFDYVIIGAGTAGSALASQLSNPDKKGKFKNSVLVLEAGVNLDNDPNVLHLNTVFATEVLYFDTKYSKTYTPIIEDATSTAAPYTDGRLWGGGSGHNGLQAYRPSPNVLNQWAVIAGNNRWAYNNLLNTIMKPMEHYTPDDTSVDLAQRGVSGPLFITQEPPVNTDPFMQSVSSVTATPFSNDLNDPTQGITAIGSNQDWVTPPWNTPQSIRSFGGNAFLTGMPIAGIPAIVKNNGRGRHGRKLRIISSAQVVRLTFDKKNVANSVIYIKNNKQHTVSAKKMIILCAGSIQDTAILQRSGIGDPELLDSLDIPVVYANPNVGANVQNQYGPSAVIANVTGTPISTVPFPQIGSGFIDLNLNPDLSPPYTLLPRGVRRYQLFILGQNGVIILSGVNVAPNSLGTVQITSTNPFVDPNVNLNQYSDGSPETEGTDANLAVDFLQFVAPAVANAFGGANVQVVNYNPDSSPEELLTTAINNNTLTYHACGSCRMAQTPATGVVDSKLRVFGVNKYSVGIRKNQRGSSISFLLKLQRFLPDSS